MSIFVIAPIYYSSFTYLPTTWAIDILWKKLQFIIVCIFFNTLLVFFVILLRTCLTKFESIKLKCYFTTLLYAIEVNISMPVSLNQYRGEIGSFYNRSTSQITDMTISLSNILVNFTKNVLVYIILLVNLFFFLTLLDQFSSCNIIYLWNFMTDLFYYGILTSFGGNFWESLTYLCYVEILNRIQDQGLIPVKASQFPTGISIA